MMQALVVQKVDNVIHWILNSIRWSWLAQFVSLTLICWIVIYMVDSAIQLLNTELGPGFLQLRDQGALLLKIVLFF